MAPYRPNKYHRMKPDELSDALNDLNLSAKRFALIAGAQWPRVKDWLEGNEDIPHSCNAIVALLYLPGAIEVAHTLARDCLIEEERDEEESAMPEG